MASLILVGCGSETETLPEEETIEINTVREFLRDVSSLEKDTNVNPIIAFKNSANDLADKKIVLTKDNINEVLNDCENFSSCVVVVDNHTVVKINSLENCQQSGSWKACMPMCSGYIKKGELIYKEDYMNNVIGIPDGQERLVYLFDPNEKQPKQNPVSYEKAPPLTYYENGKVKVTGHGFKKFYRYFVSAKEGIYLLEGADLKSKTIKKIPDGCEVFLKSKSEKMLTVLDTTNETNTVKYIDGEWVEIGVELDLSPGDQGYYYDEIDDGPSKLFDGYVVDVFLEEKLDSTKKNGVWTYFYESGTIEKEVFYLDDHSIKEINYDTDGDITKINEERVEGEVRYVYNSFYKNGNIKYIGDGDEWGAVSKLFKENEKKYAENWDYKSAGHDLNKIVLSKNIGDLFLYENESISQKLKISDDNVELISLESTGNVAEIIGPKIVDNSFYFNGSNDRILIDNDKTNFENQSFTISLSLKTVQEGYAGILLKSDEDNVWEEGEFHLYLENGHVAFVGFDNEYIKSSEIKVNDGNWHNIVITNKAPINSDSKGTLKHSSIANVYIDGKNRTKFYPHTNYRSDDITNSDILDYSVKLGVANNAESFDNFKGHIKNLSLFNTDISSDNASLISTGKDPVKDLSLSKVISGYWKLNDFDNAKEKFLENNMLPEFSGVYGYKYENAGSGEIRIHPDSDTSALFHLDVYNGPPAYNSGSLYGRVIMKEKNEFVFSEIIEFQSTKCILTFYLDADGISVSNSNPNGHNQCGFGNNVDAAGTYPLIDPAVPQFYYSGEGSEIPFEEID